MTKQKTEKDSVNNNLINKQCYMQNSETNSICETTMCNAVAAHYFSSSGSSINDVIKLRVCFWQEYNIGGF